MENELKRTAAEIEDLIRQFVKIMNKRLRDSVKHTSITSPQLFALLSIYRESGLTIGDLCERMFLACSTISGLIDRLEKTQLVERYRDEDDRRVVRLKLTEKGVNCTKSILEKRKEQFEKDLKMIDIERQEELITNLNLLLRIMKNAEAQTGKSS